MYVRIGFTISVLLALIDLQNLVDRGHIPLVVTVAGAVLGVLTLLGVAAHRRSGVPMMVVVIVSRVLSAVLAIGGLIATQSPTGVRFALWVYLALSAAAVLLLARGLAQRPRVGV